MTDQQAGASNHKRAGNGQHLAQPAQRSGRFQQSLGVNKHESHCRQHPSESYAKGQHQ